MIALKSIISTVDKRSVKVYKNIVALFTIKGAAMLIGFVVVPLTLHYLDSTRYGIWITISTFFSWLALFDIGLGNGLRNRLAESVAKNDLTKARIYVSTTYAGLAIIFTGVYVLFYITNLFLNWTSILNTSVEFKDELSLLVRIVFLFFCIQFVLNLINTIALAKQEPALTQAFGLLSNILSLVGIYLLTEYTSGRLIYLGVLLAGVPLVTGLTINIVLFNTRYKSIKPSIKFVHFSELKSLLNIGLKFFLLQIIALIFYQTNIIIIAQLFGPVEVTPYSIAFRYFGIASFVFTTILTPYWSAITDAYTKGEISWIIKVMGSLKRIWLGLFVFVVVLFFLSNILIHIWIGDYVKVDSQLYFVMGVYVLIISLQAIYSSFLNGVGVVMIQFYTAVALAFFHIPLAIFFGRLYGIKGTLFSLIFFGIIQVIVLEIQYRKIINHSDSGIWSK